jgi:formylmethanofuran dehydrogenase subunit E
MKRSTRFSRNLLKTATDFHGHLGPYLVLGLRMGLIANKTLQPRRLHDISATVWTKQSPPESCLLDGIQVSSGCTFGKTNLRTRSGSRIQARFRKGNRSLLIRPTEETVKLLRSTTGRRTEKEVENLAVSLGSMPDRALFFVKCGTLS